MRRSSTEGDVSLPEHGRSAADVRRDLDAFQTRDVNWKAGRAFTLAYHAGDDVLELATAANAARERGHARGIATPEMVLPTTAHAAFEKAAHYFGVASIRVPVDAAFRADAVAMRERVTANTVLIVGSAPAYPQGVVDPIP